MTTETEAALIVQVPRDGAVDRNWREDLPPSIANGEVIMSVLSPEALREQDEIRDVIDGAAAGEQALVILVEAAEYMREDELAVVLDAANRAHRVVILRVMADA